MLTIFLNFWVYMMFIHMHACFYVVGELGALEVQSTYEEVRV